MSRPKSDRTWNYKRLIADDDGFIDCAYCEMPVHYINTHIDHIIPYKYKKGSSRKRLVIVCSDCNIKKQTNTLEWFCSLQGLDYGSIIERLDRWGKDYSYTQKDSCTGVEYIGE